MNMEELTIAFVNFNTPRYILPFIGSLHKMNPWFKGEVHIYDNGSKNFDEGVYQDFVYHHVDNNFYDEFLKMKEPDDPGCRHFCSAKHCKTLQQIIDNTKTKYLLICDSDIIFTQNFEELFSTFVKQKFAACGFIKKQATRVNRLVPWFSLLNLELIKENKIKYYDEQRMYLVHGNTTHDTGASFLEDCYKHHLPILEIPNDNVYYIHYKGGSYENQRHVLKWLSEHQKFWN